MEAAWYHPKFKQVPVLCDEKINDFVLGVWLRHQAWWLSNLQSPHPHAPQSIIKVAISTKHVKIDGQTNKHSLF